MFYVPEIFSLKVWRLFIYKFLFAFIEMEKHGKSSCLHAPRTQRAWGILFWKWAWSNLAFCWMGMWQFVIFLMMNHISRCALHTSHLPGGKSQNLPSLSRQWLGEPNQRRWRCVSPWEHAKFRCALNSHVCDNLRWQLKSMASTYTWLATALNFPGTHRHRSGATPRACGGGEILWCKTYHQKLISVMICFYWLIACLATTLLLCHFVVWLWQV